jgi:hypothetical protein
MEFQATCKKTGERLFISAPDYHAAAKKAANLLNHTRGLTACRETGTPGMGGCFQGYTSGNPVSAVGFLFHLAEVPNK